MWKFIQRGLRESFERGLNFGRNDVKVNREKTTYCRSNVIKAPLSTEARKLNFNEKYDNGEDDPNRKRHRRYYGTQDSFDRLLGAFSCSSVVALGWSLTINQCNLWHKSKKRKNLTDSAPFLITLLSNEAIAQPQHAIKPVELTNKIIESDVAFGPITAEEALEEAYDKFEKAYNYPASIIENKQGVRYIEGPQRNGSKAVKLFKSSAKRGYIPAYYNLGLCYEQGIGTKQNFKEAAKCYIKAAEGGHGNAMFNLGVFYSHGWGGLEASTKKAREWLEAAAKIGQKDALAALGLTKDGSEYPNAPDITKDWGFTGPKPNLDEISNNPDELFNLALSYENSRCEDGLQPLLVMKLYKLASDLGHIEAKSRYQTLKAYNSLGLLSEYICRGSASPTALLSNIRFPSVF